MAVVQNRVREEEKGNMKHIDEFTIHSFRGLQDVKLEGLGQINLLVGDNNSGKTSVLEALSIFCNSQNRSRWLTVATAREPVLSNLSQDERIVWLFPQRENDQNLTLSLSASGTFHTAKVIASCEQLSENIQFRPQKLIEGEVGIEEREREVKIVKVHVSTSLDQNSLEDHAPTVVKADFAFPETRPRPIKKGPDDAVLPSQLLHSSSHRLSNIPPLLWSDVVNTETKPDVIHLIRLFDTHIQDVDIVLSAVERPTVSVKHEKLKRAPLTTFGDGLRRVFTLASAIPSARNGLLLIDELEMAIHFGALEKTLDWLIKLCIQENVQLFVTTHSLETVDALIDACKDSADLTTYRLERYKEKIAVTRLDEETLTTLREGMGLEVR